jgi:hypothetical protein
VVSVLELAQGQVSGSGGTDATVGAAPAGDIAGFGATIPRRWFGAMRQSRRRACGAAARRLFVCYDGYRDLPPKNWTGLGSRTLSESWADVAQGRMQAARIVEALDILKEISTGLGAGAINPMVNPLGLEAVKEAFHWCVV